LADITCAVTDKVRKIGKAKTHWSNYTLGIKKVANYFYERNGSDQAETRNRIESLETGP
jgi:hypothetical protein